MSDFTPHEAPIHEAPKLPVPLPTKLVGRDAPLAQVYSQLKENKPVLITGPMGAGKTAMAATLASAYAQQPGGVLWLHIDNPRLEDLLVRVGRAYEITEIMGSDTPLGMIGAVENTLRAKKPLVVLDGSISADVAGRFISRCVTGIPAIIASEDDIDGPWETVELGPLDAEHALTLFKQESRLSSADFDSTLQQIVKAVDHSPFGIVILARSMIANKLTPDALNQLVQPLASAAGSSPAIGLTAAFGKLNGALQGLLLMMGATSKGEISAELLSSVSGAPLDSVQQAINILAQLYMVNRSFRYGLPYYSLHPLTFAFAQGGLRRSGKLEGLQEKVRDAILSFVRTYSSANPDAYNKLGAEMGNITDAARYAAQNGQNQVVNDLVTSLSQAGNFVKDRGYLYDLLQLRALTGSGSAFPAYPREEIEAPGFLSEFEDEDEEEIEVPDFLSDMGDEDYDEDEDFDDEDFDDDDFDDDEDEFDDDDEEVSAPDFLNAIGAAEIKKTEIPTDDIVQLRALLTQARQSEDQDQQIKVLKAIGRHQLRQGQKNEALATYNELLTIFENEDDEAGELEVLTVLTQIMTSTENSQAAVMNASRGIKLARKLEDLAAQVRLLITLGDAHQQLGESNDAINHYMSALQLIEAGQDPELETMVLYKLGYAQLDDANPDSAIQTWEKALAQFKAQNDRSYEGRTLAGLGNAYGDLGRWAEAVNYHTSSLHIAREVGDKDEESMQLNSLAYAAYQANQLSEAVLRYRQALHLAYENQDRDNIVSTIVDLSRLLLQSRMYLDIVEMLVNDALTYEAHDRDLMQLSERIGTERALAQAYNTPLKPVKGSARDYAENAYRLLED